MSDHFLQYSERMLQIGDYVPLCKQPNAGRLVNKVKWQANAILCIWKDCASLDEFARRCNLSVGKARSLDAHFGRIFGTSIKEKTPPKPRIRKTELQRAEDKLSKMFGF